MDKQSSCSWNYISLGAETSAGITLICAEGIAPQQNYHVEWRSTWRDRKIYSAVASLEEGNAPTTQIFLIIKNDQSFVAILPPRNCIITCDSAGIQKRITWSALSCTEGVPVERSAPPSALPVRALTTLPSPGPTLDYDYDDDDDDEGDIIIDVLAGFSTLSAREIGDHDAFALAQIETVNQALRNTHVEGVKLRLVATAIIETDLPITGDTLSKLETLFQDSIAAYHPDLITAFFIGNEKDDAVGLAYSLSRVNINKLNFSCSFRHEIGHNVGGGHCAPLDAQDDAYGWGPTCLCGNTMGYYSNPECFDNAGEPLGHPQKANMARHWRKMAPIISSYTPAIIPIGQEKSEEIAHASVNLNEDNNYFSLIEIDVPVNSKRMVISAVSGPRTEEKAKITLFLTYARQSSRDDYDYRSRTEWNTFLGVKYPPAGKWFLAVDSGQVALEDIIVRVLAFSDENPLPQSILRNPSAETGDLEGWTVDKGEFRVVSIQDDIHPAAGDYFFTARLAGDFTDGIDQMSQRVYLDKFALRQGYYTATLKFKSNGWGDGDYGVVTLHAMDCMGKTLDSQHVRTLGKHKIWLDNTVSLALPVDTHSLLLEVQAVRVTGATSDVHFDYFRLTIDQNLPTQLQNPSAETGDLTGWRLQKGEFRVVEEQDGILPLTGKYFITARLKGTFADDHDQMSQEIAVAPSVDLNQDVIARLQFASNGFGDGDYGMVRLIAKNHHGHSLTSKLITTKGTKQRWLDYVIALPLPPDTASLLLEVNAFRISGSTSDVHFSDFTLAFISSTLTFGD